MAASRRAFTIASQLPVSADEATLARSDARADAGADARPSVAPLAVAPAEAATRKRALRLVTAAALSVASAQARVADRAGELRAEISGARDVLTPQELSAVLVVNGLNPLDFLDP